MFYELWNSTANLHTTWKNYFVMYGDNSNFALFDDPDLRFFWTIRPALGHDIILRFARLTDPPETGKPYPVECLTCKEKFLPETIRIRRNLTLLQLPDLITDVKQKRQVNKLLNDISQKTKVFKEWRNQHIAHDDFDRAIGASSVNPLGIIDRSVVEPALRSIMTLLNFISNENTDFDKLIIRSFLGGPESLLHLLKDRSKGKKEEPGCPPSRA